MFGETNNREGKCLDNGSRNNAGRYCVHEGSLHSSRRQSVHRLTYSDICIYQRDNFYVSLLPIIEQSVRRSFRVFQTPCLVQFNDPRSSSVAGVIFANKLIKGVGKSDWGKKKMHVTVGRREKGSESESRVWVWV